jgi:urease accessory protein
MPTTHAFTAQRRWPASLDCSFRREGRRTVLSRLRFDGPLRVQRLFYPEAEEEGVQPCHCYLLHPPGALVSGDDLAIRCTVGPGAHCLITTPSAGKILRADSHGVAQRQTSTAHLEEGLLEWLPQETIVFAGAAARLSSSFFLRGKSRLLGWDILCLGRPAGREPFTGGSIAQRLQIWRDKTPLLHEHLRLEADGALRDSPAGLRGFSVCATFFACGRMDEAGDEASLREACGRLQHLEDPECGCSGATCRGSILLARYLGNDAARARQFCLAAWATVRPALLGRKICPPRIWHV